GHDPRRPPEPPTFRVPGRRPRLQLRRARQLSRGQPSPGAPAHPRFLPATYLGLGGGLRPPSEASPRLVGTDDGPHQRVTFRLRGRSPRSERLPCGIAFTVRVQRIHSSAMATYLPATDMPRFVREQMEFVGLADADVEAIRRSAPVVLAHEAE